MYESQYGNNPTCGDLGLSVIAATLGGGSTSYTTTQNAYVAIVKDGTCEGAGGTFFAYFVSPVPSGTTLQFDCNGKLKNLSHVHLCGCPAR